MCQNSIEVELDKRGGKNFGPPGGKKMTIFMDDVSMPEVHDVLHYTGLPLYDMLVCFVLRESRTWPCTSSG